MENKRLSTIAFSLILELIEFVVKYFSMDVVRVLTLFFCFQSKLVFTLLVFKWCYFAMCWGISVQKEGGWLPFLKISKKNSKKSENIIRNWNCVFFLCPMQLSSFCVGQHLSSKRIFLNFFVRKKVVIMLFVKLMDGRFVI
jgi:hypothetical protein